MYSKPPEYPENPFWAHKAACPATVFFFPRLAGQDRLDYSVLDVYKRQLVNKGLMACPRILAGLQSIPQPPEDGTGQSKML